MEATPGRRLSKLAVASLAFAVASLSNAFWDAPAVLSTFALLATAGALLFGIAALGQIGGSERRLWGNVLAVGAILIVLVRMWVTVFLMMP